MFNVLQECDDLILLHLGYLDYTSYVITVYFYGLDTMKYKIHDIQFQVNCAALTLRLHLTGVLMQAGVRTFWFSSGFL